jgi:excisionase family DNA binding protein
MATRHKLGSSSRFLAGSPPALGRARLPSEVLAHLPGMETNNAQRDAIEPALSLSELAARLRVSVQTIYDLRSQGRGPRGFRVGRELRFRVSEVDAWLVRMEEADAERHRPRGARS